MNGIHRRELLKLAGAAGVAAMLPLPALADVSFAGETIEMIVPFSPGGGSDTLGKFNAPFLSKHLPGKPSVIVVSDPGGGSTKGANLYAARAKADGLQLLSTSASTQFPYLLRDPRVRYEYKDWQIVMATPTGGVVYVSPTTGVTGPEDAAKLMDQSLVYASQGATSLDLVPLLAFRLLGLDVRHVFGFGGRGDARLAFERGEANIDSQTSAGYLKNVQPLVDEGKAVPLFFAALRSLPAKATSPAILSNISAGMPSMPFFFEPRRASRLLRLGTMIASESSLRARLCFFSS